MNILLQKPKKISTLELLAYYDPVRQIIQSQQGQQLLDYTGNNNHGIFGSVEGGVDNNDPIWEGDNLHYDTDDYTSHPLAIFSPLAGTFEVVFNAIDSYGGLRVLGSDHSVGNNSENRTYIDGNMLFGLSLFNGVTSARATITLPLLVNTIYTCSWYYNGVNTRMYSYFNGKPIVSTALNGMVVAPNLKLYMGWWSATNYSRFKLFRSLFYNRQLSSSEIWNNYVAHKKELKINGVILP